MYVFQRKFAFFIGFGRFPTRYNYIDESQYEDEC